MYKYEAYRYINAGTNEFYRWGKKAQNYVKNCMKPENGFYSILADGGNYWTIGTSEGKYGEYAKFGDTFFSVNRAGFVWAKEGTEKAEKFIAMLQDMLDRMVAKSWEGYEEEEDEA